MAHTLHICVTNRTTIMPYLVLGMAIGILWDRNKILRKELEELKEKKGG